MKIYTPEDYVRLDGDIINQKQRQIVLAMADQNKLQLFLLENKIIEVLT